MQKIKPCLWFDGNAEEAAEFYVGVFPNSRITSRNRAGADWPAGKAGDVILVEFDLNGQPYQALNGGPDQPFSEAVSLSVTCDDQAEVDAIWAALQEGGGSEIMCGWLKDRFGFRWQIVPARLEEMMRSDDAEKLGRVTQAMFSMVKLDEAELERAFNG
mmetsp:Transcript_2328/g.4119  ORF Transcript_2328/g.4119 Transcript_2328/m.4119 type:complete len:159 (-) Transcript_2328:41-517(-)